MTKLLIRLALIFVGLISVSLFIAQARPHDSRLLSVLASPNCEAPCFIGIRPGITLADEAITRLEAHAWVENIEIRYSDFRQHANTFWGYVYWEWKPDTPLWVQTPAYQLARHTAFLRIRDGLVSEIAFSTSLPLGDVVLGLGEVGQYILAAPNRYGEPPYTITHNFYFPEAGFVMSSVSLCPALNPDWRQATTVTLRDAAYMASFSAATARQLSMDAQRSQVRAWCR